MNFVIVILRIRRKNTRLNYFSGTDIQFRWQHTQVIIVRFHVRSEPFDVPLWSRHVNILANYRQESQKLSFVIGIWRRLQIWKQRNNYVGAQGIFWVTFKFQAASTAIHFDPSNGLTLADTSKQTIE